MTVAVYVRVSSSSQKADSQVNEIANWLCANGYDPGNVRWFSDTETGKTLLRPEFQKLQDAIFQGHVKTVVLWKLDRLSRRLKDGINLLADWCERGLRVVVITQSLELSGAVGRMMAAVLLGLAEIEMEHRQERQMAGIVVAKRNGVYKGRRRGTTKAQPIRAVELRQRGFNVGEIAQAMGTSRRTVQRYFAFVGAEKGC